MNTLYSHTIRLLACQHCGAPMDAAIAGGHVRCSYCSATNVITRRDEGLDRERAEAARRAPISESERHAQLRLQDQGAERVPESLEPWITSGALNPAFLSQARHDWQLARQQLAAGSAAFTLAERFFYLTVLLLEPLDDRQQRAYLETAAELLTDARHRHVVRCMLARLAAQHGDVAGAEAWLETCNPRPTDLIMDTAYRCAAATLAIARSDFARVVELLGHRSGDVPLADRQQLACELLRVHALELLGHVDHAAREVRGWLDVFGAEVVHRAIGSFAPLRICPRSYAQATRERTAAAEQARLQELVKKRGSLAVGARAFVPPFARLPLWALALLIPVSAVRCTADADPLMGAYGVALCPYACEGCRGPTRTVTRWTQTGPGEWSSDGAHYFCNPPGQDLSSMSAEQLEASVSRLRPYELGFTAAAGGSFLILMGLLAVFAPLSGLRRHFARAGEARALDEEIHALGARLGRGPPPLEPSVSFAWLVAGALAWLFVSIAGALVLVVLGV